MYSPRRFKYIISDNKEAVQNVLRIRSTNEFRINLTTHYCIHYSLHYQLGLPSSTYRQVN